MAESKNTEKPSEQKPALEIVRSAAFQELYSNNVQFEISVWDLKMLFGLLDQSKGKEVVEHHTAISIPWPQVKLLSYFLQANIAIHEIDEGVIKLPERLWPAPPHAPKELEHNAQAQQAREVIIKLREAFIAEQKRA